MDRLDKIKILYVHHGGGQGGAPQSLLYLLKHLDRNRYEPFVACGFDEPYAKLFFEKHGFNPINIPAARFCHICSLWWPIFSPRGLAGLFKWIFLDFPRSVKALEKVLDDVSPAIVHLNSLTIAPLALVAKRKGVSVVLHVREPVKRGFPGVRWYCLRWLANHCADRVIYICKDNQDRLTGMTEHSSVVYNPIPFEKFDRNIDGAAVRDVLGIPLDSRVLLFPGGANIVTKGVYPFLYALRTISKKCDKVLAVIPNINTPVPVWRGYARKRIEKIIEKNGLEKVLLRVPFSDSVQQYFAVADVVVTPFSFPHFSRAVIEAGAMSKPVVGSRIGGIEEVVDDGVTGLLARANDPEDLADKLSELISSRERRRKMGEAGFKKAFDLYRAENYAPQIMKIYASISRNPSQKRPASVLCRCITGEGNFKGGF